MIQFFSLCKKINYCTFAIPVLWLCGSEPLSLRRGGWQWGHQDLLPQDLHQEGVRLGMVFERRLFYDNLYVTLEANKKIEQKRQLELLIDVVADSIYPASLLVDTPTVVAVALLLVSHIPTWSRELSSSSTSKNGRLSRGRRRRRRRRERGGGGGGGGVSLCATFSLFTATLLSKLPDRGKDSIVENALKFKEKLGKNENLNGQDKVFYYFLKITSTSRTPRRRRPRPSPAGGSSGRDGRNEPSFFSRHFWINNHTFPTLLTF